MNDVVLYCKSYNRDIERVKVLAASVLKHNKDNIPFIISVPSEDVMFFQQSLADYTYPIICDKDIVGDNLVQDWKTQQVVKMMFWKTGLCKNYVILDSDSYFIRDFHKSDFLVKDDVPYTVMHEQKELFSWTVNHTQILGFDPMISFGECRQPVMDLFDRPGRLYDFGPVPVVWSAKVWQTLEEDYLRPNGLTFANLIQTVASEFSWYGEWLLVKRPIELWPVEPIFKVFHYQQQYVELKNMGYTEDHLKRNYLGIVMQSSGGCPLKY